MKNRIIVVLTFFACCVGTQVFAQNADNNITGFVIDKFGKPIYGASVSIAKNPYKKTETDRTGKFEIDAQKDNKLDIVTTDEGFKTVKVEIGKPMTIIMDYAAQPVNIGYDELQNISESTGSISYISGDRVNKRGSRDISNALFGNGLGLTTLENSDDFSNSNNHFDSSEPTFYIRGLQTLSTNTPLILVDGIERDMSCITPEEVQSVTLLKDAAATAIYGYKGINGVINVLTKRGKYNTKEINFSYDHVINWDERRPKFVNALTYANAMNEALTNDGDNVKYSQAELDAFKSGNYPYLYPNVNWTKSTFKDACASDVFNMSFQGGGSTFRYYTLANLFIDMGLLGHSSMNDGYSTQNKFSKANLRTNLDIDLTPKTKLVLNMFGALSEASQPGNDANLWKMIYTIPAAAFPIKTQDGIWGGNATWDGTNNPVAESEAAGYAKWHMRTLFADMTLKQDLSSFVPGLGASFQLAYDNSATYKEKYSKTYAYGSDAVTSWNGDEPTTTQRYTGGTNTELADSAGIRTFAREFNFAGGFNYKSSFGQSKVYSQLKYNYEFKDDYAVNDQWYNQNISFYTHYGYKDRYFGDLTLVESASNKLAPGHKWGFSPTVSAAWVLSKENFMRNAPFVNFLKLRASFGIINTDNIPDEDYWDQTYTSGSLYNFDSGYTSSIGSWKLGQLASINATHEKAYKYDLGIDATLFKSLNLTFDGYFQRRSDIWVSTSGKYSTVLGSTDPYANDGIVNSWGFEVGADYTKKLNEVTFNIGGNFSLAKNKIIAEDEAPEDYTYLNRTGKPLDQIFGLKAIGLFKDQNDINNSPTQTFSTVQPGDIKYKDVNGDGKIDADDEVALGHNTVCPEIYYSFNLGAEWKGLGFSSSFQGTANYSAILNTQSVYWPLINNTNISTSYYKNRWTAETTNAKYPRLSSQSNKNNYQTNSLWVVNRSFLKLRYVELYYNLPQSFLKHMKIMNSAKFYVRGTDLLCFDHIKIADPESYGTTNPLTRSIIAGLRIGF